MPRSFRRIRPYRKFKKYGKRFGRSRWKNKKFTKFNNKTRLSVRGLIMPKSAYVKLPWRQVTSSAISAGNSINAMWIPTAYIPNPTDYTTLGRVYPSLGDKFTNGIVQYAQFFDTGYVLGSSIKLQILNANSVVNGGMNAPILLATLVAYPYIHTGLSDTTAINVRLIYDYLNSLSDDNLQSLAYAQSRMVTMAAAKQEIFFKTFRKTKAMCGIKDIEDNEDMEMNIPQSDTNYNTDNYGAKQGFVYYLRVTNLAAAANNTAVMINCKLTQYWKFTNRRPILQGEVAQE